ncbi:RecB family exonuclease [Lysinibacillus sp. UGB7]|uniref:RecB family exonuclease n=1 Tax=Lysinibacillus sp. UGB7 TaxID=3411039 RepID=UPI003B829C50
MEVRIQKLLKERTFSFSRLTLYEDCPFAYFLRYVEEIETVDSLPLAFGKATHRAIEEKMKGAGDKEALITGWKEVDYYPFDLEEYEKVYRRADVERGEAINSNVQTEIHFKLQLEDNQNSPYVQGFVDVHSIIYGNHSFIDWKTNRVMYDPLETMQLPLYSWAIGKIYNVTSVRGTLYFLRFYRNNQKTALFDQKDMEKARIWALGLANQTLESLENFRCGQSLEEAFPARANMRCANCPFAYICVDKYANITN